MRTGTDLISANIITYFDYLNTRIFLAKRPSDHG